MGARPRANDLAASRIRNSTSGRHHEQLVGALTRHSTVVQPEVHTRKREGAARQGRERAAPSTLGLRRVQPGAGAQWHDGHHGTLRWARQSVRTTECVCAARCERFAEGLPGTGSPRDEGPTIRRARSSNSAQARFRPGSGALPTLTRVGDYDGPASTRGPGRAAGESRPPLRRRGGVGSAAPPSPPGRRGGRPPLSAATRRPDRAPFPGRADRTPTSTVLHPRDLPAPGSSPGTCGALRMLRPQGCIILA